MGDQENQSGFLESNVRPLLQEEEEETVAHERSVSLDGEPTMKGILRITLKVGKARECSMGGGEGRVEYNQRTEKENRVCKVCNKIFSSGRALGGHMRVHSQVGDGDVSKKNQNPKLKMDHQELKNHLRNLSAHIATDESIEDNPKTNSNATCSLCRKIFPSMKSLFGHMRCHPERQWRGIQPPQNQMAKNSSSSTVSDSKDNRKMDDHQIDSATTTAGSGSSSLDLVQSLSSWSVTAKRGRKSIASVNSEERLPDAVFDLMMLAQGDSLDSALSNKRRSEESDGTHKDFSSKNAKIEDRVHVLGNFDQSKKQRSEESEAGNMDLLSKKLKIDGGERYMGVSRTGFDPESMNMDSECKFSDRFGENSEQKSEEEPESKYTHYNKNKKNKKKKIKFRDLETVGDMGAIDYKQTPTRITERYKCTTCNKSFPSHQALGGHRSSHKKVKNSFQATDMEEFALANASSEEEQYGIATNLTQLPEFDDTGSKMVTTHRCNICNKTFATGQALGGHKRCHFNGPVEAPPSSVASSPEKVSKTVRKLFDFDLNELPAMEDDNEDCLQSASTQSIGNKHGLDYDASSSYNSVN